jgi:DNA-directed RNA polymerase subunit M/transcription elongation factor TFIIS
MTNLTAVDAKDSNMNALGGVTGTNIIYRKESIQMICEILARGKVLSSLDAGIRMGIALGLERGIYNRAIDLEEKSNVVASWIIPSFITTYKMSRHLLIEKIAPIETDSNLERILFDSKRWETLAAKNIRKISERKSIVVKIKYTNIKCGNCGKYMVREGSSQTRSADESSTPYQICDGCNTETRLSS